MLPQCIMLSVLPQQMHICNCDAVYWHATTTVGHILPGFWDTYGWLVLQRVVEQRCQVYWGCVNHWLLWTMSRTWKTGWRKRGLP